LEETKEMAKRLLDYMVDQHDEPLKVGQCYGVHLTGDQTRASVWYVREFVRDLLVLDQVDPSQRQRDGQPVFTGKQNKYTNLTAGTLQFVRLDSEYKTVDQLAEPAKAKRARNLRRGLIQIAKEAKVLRAKQRRLIQEVAVALEGATDPTEVGDMAATFVRDDHSHVTVADLVRVYSESLHRNERGE
jgi:hypothetical protein